MLPTIRANLILTGLQAVEKAQQDREESSREAPPALATRRTSAGPGVTYSANVGGTQITLSQPEEDSRGCLLDCEV